jgi:DNA transformation protein and related proteins
VPALRELLNIGEVVAAELEAAGIRDAEALRAAGSIGAALRLRSAGFGVCRSMLGGLEGAVRGLRWHLIPPEERRALWDQLMRLTAED